MQINLTGHHVEITDSLRNYVDTKFSKLERHFETYRNVTFGEKIFFKAFLK